MSGCILSDYRDFIASRSQVTGGNGFAPLSMPKYLFPFQSYLVDWNLRMGRSATFADCGMGKTPMALVWAENVVRHTNGRVLILTPIAVGAQMVREAEKFGVEVTRTAGELGGAGVYITNYEKLHLFSPSDFVGVVCDESSILKNFDGATRGAVTEFLRTLRYRLLLTATAAPNDFVELGTSSEALGQLGHMDMLGRFFKNDQNTADTGRKFAAQGGGKPTWRFKGHAEPHFWRWVASWARAVRRPSDLGFSDDGFSLPSLIVRDNVVRSIKPREGMLFALAAHGLSEQKEERRRTLRERCEKAAEIVLPTGKPAVCWTNLNDEADTIEALVPGSVQVSGRDTDEEKEEKFLAFERGEIRVLVIKPVIGAWGLNWQHCAHMTVFAGYSWEQYYQGIRRCLRYGQKSDVVVDRVASDGEAEVLAALDRKAAQSERMFSELIAHMRSGMTINRDGYGKEGVRVPAWMK